MTGIDLDAVAEIDELVQREKQLFGPVARFDREVGPRRVADEE